MTFDYTFNIGNLITLLVAAIGVVGLWYKLRFQVEALIEHRAECRENNRITAANFAEQLKQISTELKNTSAIQVRTAAVLEGMELRMQRLEAHDDQKVKGR